MTDTNIRRSRKSLHIKAFKMLEGAILKQLVEAMNDCHVQFKLWLEKEK